MIQLRKNAIIFSSKIQKGLDSVMHFINNEVVEEKERIFKKSIWLSEERAIQEKIIIAL